MSNPLIVESLFDRRTANSVRSVATSPDRRRGAPPLWSPWRASVPSSRVGLRFEYVETGRTTSSGHDDSWGLRSTSGAWLLQHAPNERYAIVPSSVSRLVRFRLVRRFLRLHTGLLLLLRLPPRPGASGHVLLIKPFDDRPGRGTLCQLSRASRLAPRPRNSGSWVGDDPARWPGPRPLSEPRQLRAADTDLVA